MNMIQAKRKDVRNWIQKNCLDCSNHRDHLCLLYFETEGSEIQTQSKIARNYLKYHYQKCDFKNKMLKEEG